MKADLRRHGKFRVSAERAAGADGRAREIRSGFPEPDLDRLGAVAANERVHDPRSAL